MRSRIYFLLLLCLCSLCYGKEVIVNPVPGTWANKQVLVLDIPHDCEAYYSINGADPVVSGFAYDGPALIDVTGKIDIRVAVLKPGKKVSSYDVTYTVLDGDYVAGNEDLQRFLSTIPSDSPILYSPGSNIEIPSTLKYAVGNGNLRYLNGRTLCFSKDSQYSGFIPLYITVDGTTVWRYMIQPEIAPGALIQRTVPFVIEDWDTLRFTSPKYIYCLDDGIWLPATQQLNLDRSVPHVLKWQSVDYDQVNPILTYKIPVRTHLRHQTLDDGSIRIYFKDGSDLCFESADGFFASGEHKSVVIDTFYGDLIQKSLLLNVYSDHVFQGTMRFTCTLDKRPPMIPVVKASCETSFSRNDVTLQITNPDNARLFYVVRDPIRLKDGMSISDDQKVRGNIKDEFIELVGNTISLKAIEDSAVYYSVVLYAQDAFGNKSEITECAYTIDSCNYYFNSEANPDIADGTKSRPYVSFTQFEKKLGLLKPTFVRMYITGNVFLPNKDFFPSYNCEIIGENEQSSLVFDEQSTFTLRVASLSLRNCSINAPAHIDRSLFTLENGVLYMDCCTIQANFISDGVVFRGDSSVIDVKNSTILCQAPTYAAVFSTNDSRVLIANANISSIASAGISVSFSLQNGHLQLRDSTCKVVGKVGRIAELFGGDCRLNGNSFVAEIRELSSAIWKDDSTKILEDSANTIEGF